MNKSSIKISLLAILLVLSTIVALKDSMTAQAVPNFYIVNPQNGTNNFTFYTNTTSVGHKFNATLWVTGWGTPGVYAWQVLLGYNQSQGGINITRAWLPSITNTSYIFTGHATVRPAPFILHGPTYYCKIGDTVSDVVATPGPEPAFLGTIEFQIIAAPTSGSLSTALSFLGIDVDTYLLDNDLATIPTTATDGNYAFNLVPKESSISIAANPASVSMGENVTINGSISTVPANASMVFAGEPVTIWQRLGTTGAFTNLTTVTTNSASVYSFDWNSSVSGTHQFMSSWPGNATYFGANSTIVSVAVSAFPSQISISASPTTIDVKQNSTISGAISTVPPNPSLKFANVTVIIWHRLETSGTFANITVVRTNSASAYTYNWPSNSGGFHQFYASWAGNSTYQAATSSIVNVTVNRLASQISIKSSSPAVNITSTVTIGGNVTPVIPTGAQIAGAPVTIWHRAGTSGTFANISVVHTISGGQYLYIWTGVEPAGTHQFQAECTGNSNYTGSISSIINVNMVIPNRPLIYVTNPQTGTNNFIFYTNVTTVGYRFNATVYINNGTNIAAWQVTMLYNTTILNATRAWIPTTDSQYIFNGVAASTFPSVTIFPGVKIVLADFTFSPTIGVTFTTPKKLGIIEFEVLATPPPGIGNSVSSGLNINNADTNMQDPDQLNIPVIASNGNYQLNYAAPTGLISIAVNPSTVTVGQSVTITGSIVYVSNTSVTFPNVRVTIWHRAGTTGAFTNLTTVLTSTTSSYTYAWTSVTPTGTHQFQAEWTGNSLYLGSRSLATANVTVNKITTTITLSASSASVQSGSTVTLSGTITPGVSGATVTILSDSTTLGTATTASDGSFSFTWTTNATGTFTLKSHWDGDATHAGADSSTVQVEVTSGGTPWLYYAIAIIVIVIIIALIVYYLRRRSQQEEEPQK